MRKIVLQRWALIFLLVSRLIIGELGHAMPMSHGMSPTPEAAVLQAAPAACPEHELESPNDGAHHVDDSGDTSGTQADTQAGTQAGTQDCCKTGECECPCLHVPCAVLESITVGPAVLERQPLTAGAQGLMLQRLSGLFRPPA